MLNPSRINLSVNTIDSSFDWRTFIASLLFFFAALVNPRDFPVNNVPLIYPLFLLFVLIMGVHNVSEGFRRTKYLSIILITYWCYLHVLRLWNERTITLGNFAYLVEPLLILCAVGMMTIRPGGAKAAIWAMVFVIILSTVGGLWIYFIGEPLESIQQTLQSSIGGDVLQGEVVRDIDLSDGPSPVKKNSGLSAMVHAFSYQLAAAIIISMAGLLSARKTKNYKYIALVGAFIILLAGMITNTERATLLSVSVGILSYFLITGRRIQNPRMIAVFIFCILSAMAVFAYSSRWDEHKTLHNRELITEETYIRILHMPKTAIESIFYEPFGTGSTTSHYIDNAYRVGWVKYNKPVSPHNHFSNVIMYTGIMGILLIASLFRGLWKQLIKARQAVTTVRQDECFILASVCIAMIVHSLTHNAGFFNLEPATLIVFGLLWGTLANIASIRYSNLLKRWLI